MKKTKTKTCFITFLNKYFLDLVYLTTSQKYLYDVSRVQKSGKCMVYSDYIEIMIFSFCFGYMSSIKKF